MSKRNSDLPIWNFFDKSVDGSKTATCNYCHRELSYRTSVTNLKQHLKQKHISVYNNLINFGKDPLNESTAPETTSNKKQLPESFVFCETSNTQESGVSCTFTVIEEQSSVMKEPSTVMEALLQLTHQFVGTMHKESFTSTGNYSTEQGIPEHTNKNRNTNIADNHTSIEVRQSKPASPGHRNSTNKNSSDLSYVKKRMDEAVTYLKNAGGVKGEIDEYELYGQLLAKKLRKLDEHQRDLAMHEIDNVMFRVKMQSASPQQRSYSTSPSCIPRKIKSPIFIVTQQNPTNIQYEDENILYQEQPPS